MADEKIINRIKKMMTLANDPGASDGERDNALRMAYATLAKYNLAMEDVHGKPQGPQEARKEESVEAYGRPWALQLASAVAELFFCTYYYKRSWTKDHVFHCFTGRESNAETAAEVSGVLIRSIFREAKRLMRQNGENVTWRRSFCTGAAFKIQERVRELQANGVALEAPMKDEDGEDIPPIKEPGTALALVNLAKTELAANKAFMKDLGIILGRGRAAPSRGVKQDAYSQGRQFGSSLSLSATKKLV